MNNLPLIVTAASFSLTNRVSEKRRRWHGRRPKIGKFDFVRKLRVSIEPVPGDFKRGQFDFGKIPVAVPQRCPKLRLEYLVEGHLQPVQ